MKSVGQAFDASGSAVGDRISHRCDCASDEGDGAVRGSGRRGAMETRERAVSGKRARTQLRRWRRGQDGGIAGVVRLC